MKLGNMFFYYHLTASMNIQPKAGPAEVLLTSLVLIIVSQVSLKEFATMQPSLKPCVGPTCQV